MTTATQARRLALLEEVREAGFAALLIDGKPYVPIDELNTIDRVRAFMEWLAGSAHAEHAWILHLHGVVLEPRRNVVA